MSRWPAGTRTATWSRCSRRKSPPSRTAGSPRTALSVTWKLKQGVKWHDGQPFTADDCVFNWEYAADPATAATTIGSYKDIKVVKVDDHTIRVEFKKPTPFWADAFVGADGMIIPKHLFEAYSGGKSREAPANLKPVGTGPYMFVSFKPGDLVQGKINPNYHVPNRPYFDTIEMKGGGDAVSAARAVLQTGEYDFAWNLQVEDEILKRLEKGGKGTVLITPSGNIEHIQLNNTDPWKEVDGERSSIKTKHPFLTDPAVRNALNLLVDKAVGAQIHLRPHRLRYGELRQQSEEVPSRRTRITSSTSRRRPSCWTTAAGSRAPTAFGEKNGVKLHMVYQTSINAPRQKNQEIVKQACQKAGISIELKSVTASVFFSSDVANPDTYTQFYSDLQMYTTTMTQPDPGRLHAPVPVVRGRAEGEQVAGPQHHPLANAGLRQAVERRATSELDPVKRAAMFIAMNDMVIKDVVVIPVVTRPASRRSAKTCTRRSAAGTATSMRCRTGIAKPDLHPAQGRPAHALAFRLPRRDCPAREPLPHPAPAARHPEPARHQRRAVHRAGAGAGRSVRRARDQSRHPAGGAGRAARQVRPG